MVTVRPAEGKDIPAILEIYNHSVLNTTSVYTYKPNTLEMQKKWFSDKKIAGYPVFVAENDSKVAGFASYGAFRLWPAYKYTVEHSLHVHPHFRRQGVAKMLLAKIIEAVKQNQLHALIAGIDASNEASIKLHEQFHFKEVAHLKEVGYKFNKWLDLKFFQLLLEKPVNPVEG